MNPRERSRATKIHGMLLVIGLLFNAAALLLLWWDGAKSPYVGADFSYSADIVTARNAYDPQKSRFFGVQYATAAFNISRLPGDGTQVKTTYGWGEGAAAQTIDAERTVDTLYGKYTDAQSSETVLAPRDLKKSDEFYFRPPGADTAVLMKFDAQETINGLAVFRFKNERTVAQPSETASVSRKPGESLAMQETFEMWAEPTSGWLVKYKDSKLLNVVGADGIVARPVEYSSSVTEPQSVEQHVAYARSLRTTRLFVTQVGPSAFVTLAIFAIAVFALSRVKRSQTLLLSAGSIVVLAVPSVVLIGWLTGIVPLTTFFLGTTAMNPFSAACFVLVGLAILAKRYDRPYTMAGLGAVVGVLSFLQLLSSLHVVSFAPDLWLFGRAVLEFDPTMPSRMSSYMSFALLIFSTLLVGIGIRRTPPLRFARFVIALTIVLGFLGIILNISQIDAVFAMPFVRSLSLVGSCGLIVAALACMYSLYGVAGYADSISYIARSLLLPMLAAVPVVIIGVFAQLQQRTVQQNLTTAFTGQIESIETAVDNRFASYANGLLGARALLLASQEVTAQEWHDYNVAHRNPDEAADFASIGYASVRADSAAVWYTEPSDRNLVGRDLYKDAALSGTMKAATASGSVQITGNMSAPGANTTQVALVAPVFKKGASVATADDRAKNIDGFVFGVVDFTDAIRTAASPYAAKMNFQVYSGLDADEETLLYEHKPEISENPRLTKQVTLFTNGQAFTVVYQAEQEFQLSPEQEFSPTAILLGGSALYFGFLAVGCLLADINRQRREHESARKAQS